MYDKTQNIYINIAENIRRDIRLGIIADGEKLPSCRELALKLGINPNTVQRAYAELEKQGFLISVPKKGVYAKKSVTDENLYDLCKKQIEHFAQEGLSEEDILKIVSETFHGRH